MLRRVLTFMLAVLTACASSKKVTPPTIVSVSQPAVCADGGTLVVTGTGIASGAAVVLATGGAGTSASQVTVSADGTTATAQFSAGIPPGGPYDLTLRNPDGGSATKAAAVAVVPRPQLFYVDPSVIYNGVSIRATVYGTGFSEPVKSVSIAPSGGGTPVSLSFSEDAAKPNQVQAVVPAGTAAGTYDLALDDAYCAATLASALTVTSQLALSLGTVTPAQGWTGSENALSITAAAGSIFEPVPRVYLNPSSGSSSSTAAALGAVALVDPADLTAIVPDGLPAGNYDLIVVNPDGQAGLAAGAYQVLPDPPPQIASLSPGALPNGGVQTFTILGANFRSPAVALACADGTGTTVAPPAVTVTASTATSITATVNATGSTAVECAVTVTNADGSFGQYAALVFTNPSQNLYPPLGGPALAIARRAPVALGGDATATARFLHVVGGDDGAGNGFDTVETAPLSLLGALGPYATQRTRLVHARAFSGGALVGRFLYVAGGSNGGTALDTVERAAVLDPADRGRLAGVVLSIDQVAGVGPGLWYYRVAAVLDTTDPVNPGGENLPSDPFPVRLPALDGAKLDVSLTWEAVSHAAKYRIYRSPTAGAAVGSEQVIAEVSAPATRFTDTGIATPISTETPLPIGSLGAWTVLPAHLSTPREGPGVAWAADPSDPATAYLYVFGGRKDGTTALSSIEFLPIALGADGTQTAADAFALATSSLSAARWQLAAAPATSQLSPRVPAGTTYLYALSGLSAGGTVVPAAEAAAVQTGGQLSPFTALPQVHRAGYGTAIAGDFVFAFGGLNGTPDTGIVSAEICSASLSGCAGQTAPAVVNWNAEGVAMTPARLLMGTTLSGAFIYVVGGVSVAGSPPTLTSSTQYFLW